ncbi:conserved hypothetical protein [Sphingomonas sp. AX6]|nr:conserved hypothetical protein [Sphingomonas sp. AX6]
MTEELAPSGPTFDVRELLTILYRRRLWLIVVLVACLIGALSLQKSIYRSSATLLIDSQLIPTTLVASPITSVANERIAKIRQQVVSRDSLTAIIVEHGLYADERAPLPLDDVLNKMRGAIGVDLVGTTENGGDRTIAFTLSFAYRDPATAQAVTRTLTDMYLDADKRIRTEQASGAAAFMGRRADELQRRLGALEESRRSIEARYAGALPSQVALSAQSESTLRAEIARIDAESQGLAQQASLLAAREREIAQAPRPEAEALRRAEERLNQLSATYSDDYPEVVAARASVERQRATLNSVPRSGGEVVQREIAAGRERIQMLAGRRAQLVASMGEMDRRTALAPQASYELTMVEREYDNLRRQYEDLREKQLDAQVAANLQAEDKGERFSVVDEPSYPYQPIGPGRIMLLAVGLIGGLGLGSVLTIGFELLRGTIHGEATLARIIGSAPIGIVPLDRRPAGGWGPGWLRSIWPGGGREGHAS